MTVCIAFFRGINVGGNHVLPMAELVERLEHVGLPGAVTYIQSGNVAFRCSSKRTAELESRISDAIEDSHGFRPRVMVIRVQELEHAVAVNPFPEATREPKTLQIWFLAQAPSEPDLDALAAVKAESERFKLDGKLFYLHAPEGIGRSKLAERVEKCLGVPGTCRNWRTATKVLELAWDLS